MPPAGTFQCYAYKTVLIVTAKGTKPVPRVAVSEVVENVLGCKWTLHVLAQIRDGVNRPGQLVRSADGLTTKVLNERLAKLVRFGVLEKRSFPEVPPRVEYRITPFGRRLNRVLDEVLALQRDVDTARV